MTILSAIASIFTGGAVSIDGPLANWLQLILCAGSAMMLAALVLGAGYLCAWGLRHV